MYSLSTEADWEPSVFLIEPTALFCLPAPAIFVGEEALAERTVYVLVGSSVVDKFEGATMVDTLVRVSVLVDVVSV